MKQVIEKWKYELAQLIPAEVYSRNKFGGTNRRVKLSEEEIEAVFDFVQKEKDESFKQGFQDCQQMVKNGEHTNCCLKPGVSK